MWLALSFRRDRQASGVAPIRRVAEAMDCRADLCVVRQIPSLIEGLRDIDRVQRMHDPDRDDQPDDPSTIPRITGFLNTFLEIEAHIDVPIQPGLLWLHVLARHAFGHLELPGYRDLPEKYRGNTHR